LDCRKGGDGEVSAYSAEFNTYCPNSFRGGCIKLRVCSDPVCRFVLCCPSLPTGNAAVAKLHGWPQHWELLPLYPASEKKEQGSEEVRKTSNPMKCPCLSTGLSTHRICFSVCLHLNRYKLPVRACLNQRSPGKQPQVLVSKRGTLDRFQSMLKPCDALAYKLIQHSWKTARCSGPTTIFFPAFLGGLAYPSKHQRAICDSEEEDGISGFKEERCVLPFFLDRNV